MSERGKILRVDDWFDNCCIKKSLKKKKDGKHGNSVWQQIDARKGELMDEKENLR